MPLLTRNNYRVAILLGALNGVLISTMLHLTEWVSGYVGWPRVNWAWLRITLLLATLFAVTSYLSHRFLLGRINSIIVLWLSIGFAAMMFWNLIFLGGAIWEMYFYGYDVLYCEVTALGNAMFGAFSFAVMLGTNLVFASSLKGITDPYAGQLL